MDQHALTTAPGLHLAQVDEDVIILDLARDRYDCLFSAAALVRIDARGALFPVDDDARDALVSAGVAERTTSDRRPRPEIIPPRRELTVDPGPAFGDICRAAIVLMSATLRFRGRSLSALVQSVPALRGTPTDDTERLSQLVGAARIARTWIPFEGECLQRSFLLRAWLASQGIATDWVFGVRTWPFSAHCWLQIGDMLVGERLERADRYTPIMRA